MKVKAQYDVEQRDSELPEWLTKQLTEDESKALKTKGITPLIDKLVTPDGKLFTGKVQLREGKNGNHELHFHNKRAQLEIPERIDDQQLTKDEIKLLKKGEILRLKSGHYIQIDTDLNKVTIHTGRDLSVLKEIGGVKLSAEEQQRYANGKSITKLMKTHGHDAYMIGTFSKGPDGSIQWDADQTKMIQPSEYDKYNIEELRTKLNFESKDFDREKVMKEFLAGNDRLLPEIKQMKAEGYVPTIEAIERNSDNMPDARKNGLLAAFGMDSEMYNRFKKLVEEKEVHYGHDPKKFKITSYNLTENSITLESPTGNKMETQVTNEIKTTQEFAQFQEQSKGKGMGQAKSMKI